MKQLKVTTLTPLYEFLINNKSTGIIKSTNEFVDLGPNIDVLWAKCNLGASSEEKTGDYYQWAGVTPVNDVKCDSDCCPYYSDTTIEKYTSAYQNLETKDDIVQIKSNGKMRIPTYNDANNLFCNTTQTLETINNIDGVKFSSRTLENKYIFIPFTGYKIEDEIKNCGISADLWLSTINGGNECWHAKTLNIGKYTHKQQASCSIEYCLRYLGLNVRGVKKK